MIYHSFFPSIMTHGLIFCGNSPHAIKIFKLQKTVIRITMGCRYRVSCRDLFKKLNIFLLKSQYTLPLMTFVANHTDCFISNKERHNADTRQLNNLLLPQVNLTVCYSNVNIFNSIPLKFKEISHNPKKLKSMLK
jgi:hypothetical protein